MCVSKHLIQEVHGYGFQPKTYPDAEKKTYKLIILSQPEERFIWRITELYWDNDRHTVDEHRRPFY